MAFNSTTGLGVAAQILSTGNIHPGKTTPGYNGVKLSLTGVGGYPETFQLDPVLADVAGTPVDTGIALVLSSVATSTVGTLTLSAAAVSVDGIHAVYTGTITGGAANAWAGYTFVVTGFSTSANNGTFLATASTTTTLTLLNASSANETHAGTATSTLGPAVYTGTIDGYASLVGQTFNVAGFVTTLANNGTFLALAATATTLTLANPNAVSETHA